MEKARRRRHVPAFGEWNYSYSDEPWLAAGGGELEACSEAWFSYPCPPQYKAPALKARMPGSGGVAARDERPCKGSSKGRLQEATRRSRASDDAGGVAVTPAKAARAMRHPVDADLYRVPPPEFVSQRPRKRIVSSLWMGCLGLNCVA